MRISLVCLLVLSLCGCVGDGVEYGGVGAPRAIPATAIPCSDAGLKRAEDGQMHIPEEVSMFFMAAQAYQSINSMRLSYDVNETGKAINVSYIGPPEYLRHATRQKLIRAASDFLQSSRYAWPATPSFATDCEFELEYVIDWDRGPDGVTQTRTPKER